MDKITYTVTVDSPDWALDASKKFTGLDRNQMAELVIDEQLALTQPCEVKVFHYPPRTSFFCYPLDGSAPLIITVIEEE